MNSIEQIKDRIENFDYTGMDEEYGPQERVSKQTLNHALRILSALGLDLAAECSVVPYEGGLDLFWGDKQGSLLAHVHEDESHFSGLSKYRPEINSTSITLSDSDILEMKRWLEMR